MPAAKAVAAINLVRDQTGVEATARTEMQLDFTKADPVPTPSQPLSYTLQLKSSSVNQAKSISFTVSEPSVNGLAEAISAINQQSPKTGVTASLTPDGRQIILSNAVGDDINLSLEANGTTNSFPVSKRNQNGKLTDFDPVVQLKPGDQVVVGGYIALDSQKSFSVEDIGTGYQAEPDTFRDPVTGAVDDDRSSSELQSVETLDVTSFQRATESLKVVDSALAYINGERAKLGALQSRFETSIASLNITSENLSASRSRILDADFAQETANLSRVQILQQAGTAMVAQANQIPQGVLALLNN